MLRMVGRMVCILSWRGFYHIIFCLGNLALSRALGDFQFKKNSSLGPDAQIITADPEITCHEIAEEDEFLVIACDGMASFIFTHTFYNFTLRNLGLFDFPTSRRLCAIPSFWGQGTHGSRWDDMWSLSSTRYRFCCGNWLWQHDYTHRRYHPRSYERGLVRVDQGESQKSTRLWNTGHTPAALLRKQVTSLPSTKRGQGRTGEVD